MQPLMNRRDYGKSYDEIQAMPVQEPVDYDSVVIEEQVPEEPKVEVEQIGQLKCPFCSSKNTFNPQSIKRVTNFSCPSCSTSVPSVTIFKQANNEYVSSIELVSEVTDPEELVEDVLDMKESLKAVKKIDTNKK